MLISPSAPAGARHVKKNGVLDGQAGGGGGEGDTYKTPEGDDYLQPDGTGKYLQPA